MSSFCGSLAGQHLCGSKSILIYAWGSLLFQILFSLPPQAGGSLKQKRDIDIKMCGASVKVEVKDASTEWAMRLAGRLKQQSLGRLQGLEPMLHEQWILELPSPDTKCNIDFEVLKPMKAARACAIDMLSKAELTCFSDVRKAPIAKAIAKP